MIFHNRQHAGQLLAEALRKYHLTKPLILALPRGGVPIALEISNEFDAPLELLMVRKIGSPFSPEFAVGALCENEAPLWSETSLSRFGLKTSDLDQTLRQEKEKIALYTQRFRNGRALSSPRGRIVVLVDDGLATGATMSAAIKYLRKKGAARLMVAVPVAARATAQNIRGQVDEVVALHEPSDLRAVGDWYEDFSQVEDQEVLELLKSYHRPSGNLPHGLKEAILDSMQPLGKSQDFDSLLESLKDKRVVMLGEATHGTDEFYRLRRLLSKRLIEEHGFRFIAVEGDWPDAYRLHRYVQTGEGGSARQVLMQNHRWPTWMWANEEVAQLAQWMRGRDVGFYGLDVYSLYDSIEEILRFLEKSEPALAQEVARNYSCFESFEGNEISYARSLLQYSPGCETEVLKNLEILLKLRFNDEKMTQDELFNSQQNARIVANAEAYYRAMLKGDAHSWNVRDGHMMETLDRLLERHGEGTKAIVWAHNTHIGDYRATNMIDDGYINLGGLARESYGDDNVALVGLGTYQGEVTAGTSWGSAEEKMILPPAMEGSYEAFFHQAALQSKRNQFFCLMPTDPQSSFAEKRGHRAVGVVYDSRHERRSQYVPTELSKRYDAFIFVDQSRALRSFGVPSFKGEFPETWPSGQ